MFKYLIKMTLYVVLMVFAVGCSTADMDKWNNGDPNQKLTLIADTSVNIAKVKVAYGVVSQQWATSKKNFPIGIIKDAPTRLGVRAAAATIDEFLASIQTVRQKGDVINKVIVTADMINFRARMRTAYDQLDRAYQRYGNEVSDDERERYRRILDNIKILGEDSGPKIDMANTLVQSLFSIGEIARAISAFR